MLLASSRSMGGEIRRDELGMASGSSSEPQGAPLPRRGFEGLPLTSHKKDARSNWVLRLSGRARSSLARPLNRFLRSLQCVLAWSVRTGCLVLRARGTTDAGSCYVIVRSRCSLDATAGVEMQVN